MKHVWTLWDLNSSKTLQMSCANLITLQSPFKYGYLDSNQGQLAPKASILPTELHPYIAERWGPDPQAFYCSHCFQDKSQSHWVTSPLPTYRCRIGLWSWVADYEGIEPWPSHWQCDMQTITLHSLYSRVTGNWTQISALKGQLPNL